MCYGLRFTAAEFPFSLGLHTIFGLHFHSSQSWRLLNRWNLALAKKKVDLKVGLVTHSAVVECTNVHVVVLFGKKIDRKIFDRLITEITEFLSPPKLSRCTVQYLHAV